MLYGAAAGAAVLALLLLLGLQRISSLEAAVQQQQSRGDDLQARVEFLQAFLALVSANMTGVAGSGKLAEELARWQAARAVHLEERLAAVRAQLHAVGSALQTLASQHQTARSLYQELLASPVVPQTDPVSITFSAARGAASQGAGWLFWLFVLACLGGAVVVDHIAFQAQGRQRIVALLPLKAKTA
jgi:hypothetical protein